MSTKKLARDSRGKYIDLKTNGRLFPSWVLANFKEYKLPEIIKQTAEDPCTGKIDNGKVVKEFKKYQVFLSQYVDYKSPYHDVLIYHGLGSGKTATAINIYNVLYTYNPGWNVFLLVKASIHGSWDIELNNWINEDEKKYRMKNIIFVHYDSPIADKSFMDAIKNVDSSKKSLYIIDEAHNFIRNVYSNVSSNKGRRAQNIYDHILQDKRENPDTRVILLSGTPAINNPFELALLFNLLRPNIFPKSENEFNHQFITSTSYQTMNTANKNLFQRRIMGLVSFYLGHTPDVYATKSVHYVDVPMSDYQRDVYNFYEEIEEKIAMKARFRGNMGSETYKSYTRQACNFVFPPISSRITGELRPRPNKFRITEREAEKLGEGKDLKADKTGKETLTNVNEYKKALESYVVGFDNYLTKIDEEDKQNNYTIINDIDVFLKKYEGDFWEFHNKETKKSKLYDAMQECSRKMVNMIFNIVKSKGPTVVYSNYVLMEGLEIFKIYLKYIGFYSYMDDMKLRQGKIGYVEFHGGIDMEARKEGMKIYNNLNNKHGEYIKIILISPAGSEGLSLRNVRQVHIMEPYWNEVRITQMIGRGVRRCSHSDLSLDERHVEVYRYRSIRANLKPTDKTFEKWTTDQYIEDLARSKDSLMQTFLDAMKEVAIDCTLNKNHNMLEQEFKCFQFEEPSLFDKYVGPAYKEDIHDDVKINNGSNAVNSTTVKIKVMKISAVMQLNNPESDEKMEYSKPKDYWFYPNSGVVYDYDLYYPIGKVGMDQDNIPMKLDKDTYIITHVIPIPNIKE